MFWELNGKLFCEFIIEITGYYGKFWNAIQNYNFDHTTWYIMPTVDSV